MAKLTLGQKTGRVVRFLIGLRRPRIAGALQAYGFTQGDLDEGWTLLRGVAATELSVTPAAAPDPSLLERLDAWENKWFVIAEASLRRRYPAIAEQLFLNLSRTTGAAVTVSVDTLLSRLAQLDTTPDGAAARALLATRGLNDATIAEAQQLLDQLGAVAAVPEPPPFDAQALAKGEAAMWAWYLEWSAIARTAIQDGRQLRILGFGTAGRSRSTAKSDADDSTASAPAAAAPSSAVA